MNLGFACYVAQHSKVDVVPAWAQSERYEFCDGFTKVLNFLKK